MNTVYEVRHRGGDAIGYAVDSTDEAAVLAAAEELRGDVGHVRIVVLNVGRLPLRPLVRFAMHDLQALFNSNVFPHFVLLKAFVPSMVQHNAGHIVYISSACSVLPSAYEGPYVATKMAVTGMMRGLREELASRRKNEVRVSCVYPYLPLHRIHENVFYLLKWKGQTMDDVARQVVNGVLQDNDTISAPKCIVFWMRILRMLPLNVQRQWRRLFLSRLRAGLTPVVRHPTHGDGEPCPWQSWSDDCPLEWRFSDRPSTTSPPYEMIADSSGETLQIGFRKPCRIKLP